MSAAQHSPGPWAVHPAKAQVDAFVGGEPLPVCQLLWPTDRRSEDETEANACLIAAAPKMLALLKELIDIEGPQPGHIEWARKVQAVIAEAEWMSQQHPNERGS